MPATRRTSQKLACRRCSSKALTAHSRLKRAEAPAACRPDIAAQTRDCHWAEATGTRQSLVLVQRSITEECTETDDPGSGCHVYDREQTWADAAAHERKDRCEAAVPAERAEGD